MINRIRLTGFFPAHFLRLAQDERYGKYESKLISPLSLTFRLAGLAQDEVLLEKGSSPEQTKCVEGSKGLERCMFLSVLFCISFVFSTPPAQERTLQANKLYQEGEFAKAYDLYNGVQYKSPEILINMGNAAYQLGRYPQALVRWRQAQQKVKLSEYRMLQDRIEKIQHEHGGQFHATFFDTLATTIDLYMRIVPHKIWELLFIFLALLCFGILPWFKARKWGRLISLFLLVLVVGAFLMVRYTVQDRLMGFVLRDTHAYVTKDSQARIKASMALGQEIEIRAIHNNWYLVTDGIVTGWIRNNDVQLV